LGTRGSPNSGRKFPERLQPVTGSTLLWPFSCDFFRVLRLERTLL